MNNATTYQAVVIGVSAGGMNALKILLPALPADLSFPVIIVQHLGPSSDGVWIALLGKSCAVELKEADEKENIKRGVVYFAPPNYHLLVERNRTFSLSTEARVNHARPAVDVLFESAADVYKQALVGIILTGAGRDGSRGLKKIKERGGLVIVQDPATAETNSMPVSAIQQVTPDHILSLENINALLNQLSRTSNPNNL